MMYRYFSFVTSWVLSWPKKKLVGIWVYLWGWMAYSILASNISYPMPGPGLFALRSTLALFCSVLYFKGSTPWGEVLGSCYHSLFYLVQGTRRNRIVGEKSGYFPLPGSLRRCLQSLSFFSGSRSHWISPPQFQPTESPPDSLHSKVLMGFLFQLISGLLYYLLVDF